MKNRERKDWVQTSLKLAKEIASLRSEDPYLQVGCCAIKENGEIVLGYNGFPSGFSMSMEDRDARRPYMIHAERNVLDMLGSDSIRVFSVTHLPCPECMKSIKSKKIGEVHYIDDLSDPKQSQLSKKMAKDFGISLIREEAPQFEAKHKITDLRKDVSSFIESMDRSNLYNLYFYEVLKKLEEIESSL